tara:strand:- start:230 stop:403 length:174 start_codon:yes stop_codon:yes gene_type:complete
MKIGDLVKMKKGFSPVGLVVDIIEQDIHSGHIGSIRVLWFDGIGKSLEFPKTLELVQ